MAERHSTGYHIPHDRPWMTALEMQFAALGCIEHGHFTTTNSNPRSKGESYALMRSGLRQAECFSWSDDMWIAVSRASRTLPPTSRISATTLPNRSGWMYFGSNHDPFEALLYTPIPHSNALLMALFRRDGSDLAPYLTFVWGFDESLEELRSASRRTLNAEFLEASFYAARFLICACAWLQQRVITAPGSQVERHRRKQLAREFDTHVSDVKVVQLRRAESQPHPRDPHADPVEWSCRWIVNGHWRNQFYPSTGKHDLKYILPYVKGPDDKPLKTPTHTIYDVSR